MSESVTKSVPQEQQEQRIETRAAVKRIGGFTIVATALAVLAVLGVVVLYAQSIAPPNNPRFVAIVMGLGLGSNPNLHRARKRPI
jgi:hypothetical protein